MGKCKKTPARKKNPGPPPKVELIDAGELKFHPRNYRKHPDDQLQHIIASIREHGFYRNVVVARDLTVLAGQGVVQAAREMGLKAVPVIRTKLRPNDPRALKLMAGDNEIGRGAEVDDRALTDLLKEVMGTKMENLLGTGFDKQQLAALMMVTRPSEELAAFDAAAEWAGMPEFENAGKPYRLVVNFTTEKLLKQFIKKSGFVVTQQTRRFSNTWWPPGKEKHDLKSVRWEGKKK